jgi:hypothetical protein
MHLSHISGTNDHSISWNNGGDYDCEISLNIPGQQIMETIRNDDILYTRELTPQYV